MNRHCLLCIYIYICMHVLYYYMGRWGFVHIAQCGGFVTNPHLPTERSVTP